MPVTEAAVLAALQSVVDPLTGLDPVSARQIENLNVEGGRVRFQLKLGYPARSLHAEMAERLQAPLLTLAGVSEVQVSFRTEVIAHAVQRGVNLLPGVKNIVAVASGKGGVGKSTTAVNLALALAAEGARVGLLDADIYGPSLPMMMGASGHPESPDGQRLNPLEGHGVQLMSIGFLVGDDQAMVWRGPMATQALDQLLRQTNWHDLDYLLVDMPPGTGDIQLTLAQRVPVTGAVIVTTPQDIALLDAQKGLRMFEKVGVPILGLIENMAIYHCPQCGHAEHIFGAGGGEKMAAQFGAELLGSLPLTMAIRAQTDSGSPTVVAEPNGDAAQRYRAMARRLAAKLATQSKDYSSKFPTITVSRTT